VGAQLAREAGAIAMRYRGGDLRVEHKAGDEPVTVADYAASEHVVAGLRAAFGDDVVVSEELPDDERRRTARRVWFVDPIDGTKDFIAGREGFAVMIGLALDGAPVAGIVYQPVGDRMFCGSPEAAWVSEGGGERRALRCSDAADIETLRTRAPTLASIGLKLAAIAGDHFDIYVNPKMRLKTWDTCAPGAILTGAGGKLTDVDGAPLRYGDTTNSHRRGIVATNGPAHAAAIAKLAPILSPR
jgi:3'(2'), 5'-bisphosphate nucleotidase